MCQISLPSEVEVPSFRQEIHYWGKPIQMLQADCGENSVLSGFHFEFSEGRDIKIPQEFARYLCHESLRISGLDS